MQALDRLRSNPTHVKQDLQGMLRDPRVIRGILRRQLGTILQTSIPEYTHWSGFYSFLFLKWPTTNIIHINKLLLLVLECFHFFQTLTPYITVLMENLKGSFPEIDASREVLCVWPCWGTMTREHWWPRIWGWCCSQPSREVSSACLQVPIESRLGVAQWGEALWWQLVCEWF